MSVDRYELVQGDTSEGIEAFMEKNRWGEWVRIEDFEELEAENKRLRESIQDAMKELEDA